MAMLVTLSDMKTYLGISGTTYDTFLTEQITLVSDVIESYCGRKFIQDQYIQTFYKDDFTEAFVKELPLFHYPVSSVASIEEDDVALEGIRIQYPNGILTNTIGFFMSGDKVEVTYTAGYLQANIPTPIQSVVKSIVEEKYNRKVSGISLNFGSDVQSISIPGAISIAFDYSLTSNDRVNAYGNLLGNYVNMIDKFRSSRAIMGSGKLEYVVEAP